MIKKWFNTYISSITFILFLTFLIAGLFPLFLQMALVVPDIKNEIEHRALHEAELEMQQTFSAMNELVERRKENVRLLGQLPIATLMVENNREAIETVHRQRLDKVFVDWFGNNKEVVSVAIIDKEGHDRLRAVRLNAQSPLLSRDIYQSDRSDCPHVQHALHATRPEIIMAFRATTPPYLSKQNVSPHLPTVRLLYPMFSMETETVTGVVSLVLDVSQLLAKLEDASWIRNDGSYIMKDGQYLLGPGDRQEALPKAFVDFPTLESVLSGGHSQLLMGPEGTEVAWMPFFADFHGDYGLWIGKKIQSCGVRQWLTHFYRQALIIGAVLTAVVLAIALFFREATIRMRLKITGGVQEILSSEAPVSLKWQWPLELRELGTGLTALSQRFSEARQARHSAQKALSDLSQKYEMILSTAMEGIMGVDAMGAVTFINPDAARMLGYGQEEISGRHLHDLIHHKTATGSLYEESECPLCLTIHTGTAHVRREDLFWRKDGSSFNVEYETAPILVDGEGIQGAVLTFRDITDRLNTERQLIKYGETQNTLFQEVNHRVKNNLSALIGMLNMERDQAESKEQADLCSTLDDLVARIRGMSTVHSLLSANQWQPLPLSHLCQRIIGDTLAFLLPKGQKNIRVDACDALINNLQAHHLALVLNELTTNSAKHGLANKESVMISVRISPLDNGAMQITYRDNGPGYPPEILDGTMDRAGIGMRIMEGIIQANFHGKVELKNDNGAVTSFTMQLEQITAEDSIMEKDSSLC
ncbi:MAG: PAS domain S-box protein [Pseudomonadota bacterium]